MCCMVPSPMDLGCVNGMRDYGLGGTSLPSGWPAEIPHDSSNKTGLRAGLIQGVQGIEMLIPIAL